MSAFETKAEFESTEVAVGTVANLNIDNQAMFSKIAHLLNKQGNAFEKQFESNLSEKKEMITLDRDGEVDQIQDE